VRILPEIYRAKLIVDPMPEVNAFPANQGPH